MIGSALIAFLTGVCQVFCVALQARQITRREITGAGGLFPIFLVGIAISSVWVLNVRAAVSSLPVGAAYVLGAGIGSVVAMKIRMRAAPRG